METTGKALGKMISALVKKGLEIVTGHDDSDLFVIFDNCAMLQVDLDAKLDFPQSIPVRYFSMVEEAGLMEMVVFPGHYKKKTVGAKFIKTDWGGVTMQRAREFFSGNDIPIKLTDVLLNSPDDGMLTTLYLNASGRTERVKKEYADIMKYIHGQAAFGRDETPFIATKGTCINFGCMPLGQYAGGDISDSIKQDLLALGENWARK